MSSFQTHITTSTLLGIAYGGAGYATGEFPLPACLLAGGLCSLAGMLPDLDSDSGVPIRETMAFAAAVTPMLMMDRLQQLGLSHESMVVAGGCIYLLVRFGVAGLMKRYTVHRGMWHSLPAAAIAGLLAFLICASPDMRLRLFKSLAVVLGFMSHLVLDELASFTIRRGRPRLKKSFGSALKLYSRNGWANISTYGKLLILIGLALGDPVLMEHLEQRQPRAHRLAREVQESLQTLPGAPSRR